MRTKHLAAVLWWMTDSGAGSDAFDGPFNKSLDDIVQDFVELTAMKERQRWLAIADGLKAESKVLQDLGKKHRAVQLRDTPFKPTGEWTTPPVGEVTPCTCTEFPRAHHHVFLYAAGGGGGGGARQGSHVIVEHGKSYEITVGKGGGGGPSKARKRGK